MWALVAAEKHAHATITRGFSCMNGNVFLSWCWSAPFLLIVAAVNARVFYQTPSTSPSNSARAFDTDGC